LFEGLAEPDDLGSEAAVSDAHVGERYGEVDDSVVVQRDQAFADVGDGVGDQFGGTGFVGFEAEGGCDPFGSKGKGVAVGRFKGRTHLRSAVERDDTGSRGSGGER
jgi:hypothetical protein